MTGTTEEPFSINGSPLVVSFLGGPLNGQERAISDPLPLHIRFTDKDRQYDYELRWNLGLPYYAQVFIDKNEATRTG